MGRERAPADVGIAAHHPRRHGASSSASWRIIVGIMAHHRRGNPASSRPKNASLGDGRAGRAMRRAARLAGLGNSPYSGRLSMAAPRPIYPHRHLLGIEGLSTCDINALLDLADEAVEVSRQIEKKKATLRGRTQINLF
ncbi:MAG: hypothetical protein ACJ8C3_22460, partial [Microvirga sp.]